MYILEYDWLDKLFARQIKPNRYAAFLAPALVVVVVVVVVVRSDDQVLYIFC